MRLAIGATRPFSPAARPNPTSIRCAAAAPTAVRLGRRWQDFQGANNWDGLLNPLDDTLRSEILRYGEFVQAAYTAFDADTSSPSYAACRFPKTSLLRRAGLPSTGYRVTRHLQATSGASLPRWASLCPAWLSRQSAWLGYVAVCQDEGEIARLGRRDVVIAYRGTVTCLEWLENLRANLTHLPCPAADARLEPMVERGFWSLFTTPGQTHASLRDQLRDEIRRLVDTYGGKPLSITVTGHSLGAALAVLTAYDITATFANSPMVTVVSFGGPRVGNASFRRRLEERGSKVLRIVNTGDVITKVPGFVLDCDAGAGADEERTTSGLIPKWVVSKTGWVYADIGQELRVSGERTANVVSCHDLEVYLRLVNQLSTTCPFRSEKENHRTEAGGRASDGPWPVTVCESNPGAARDEKARVLNSWDVKANGAKASVVR